MKNFLNNISIKNEKFNSYISNKTTTIKGPKRPLIKALFWILLIGLLIYFLTNINWRISKEGFGIFASNIKRFFQPVIISNYIKGGNLFYLSIIAMAKTFLFALIGTLAGGALAFITSIFSNYKMNNKYVAITFKIITTFLRILPELIFIYLFILSFDRGISLFLIYCWFSWLWLHEYFTQTIMTAEFSIYYQILKTSNSKFKAFFQEILPQIKNKFINYMIFSLESNIRWGALLSMFGFINIGTYLNSPITTTNYKYFNELMVPLFVLTVFFLLFDGLIYGITNFILKDKTITIEKFKTVKRKKYIKTIFLILFSIFILVMLSYFIYLNRNNHFYPAEAKKYLVQLFNPNWKNIKNDNVSIFSLLSEYISLITITLILCFAFTYIKLIFKNYYLNKKVYYILKIKNTAIRFLPVTILFILFYTFFITPQTAFVFAFAIHSSTALARNLEKKINDINLTQLKVEYHLTNSKFQTFNKFIFPYIKPTLLSLFTYEAEKTMRNFVLFGSFTSSLLGLKATLARYKEFNDIAPYIWIQIFIVGLVTLGSWLIRRKYINQ
ncbi:PhnE/PtxC family ABC transporter permease [Metamycoplasma orale]|nr:hypothetical protein [Metamycoplasma orale]